MPVPAANISNTVLRKPLPLVAPSVWDMYITTRTTPWEDVEVYVETGGIVVYYPPAAYLILVGNASWWEFTFSWVGPAPAGDHVIIFRRVRGVVIPLAPGAFLSAEALNQRFDLENLGINDLQYYQQKTNPSYSPEAITLHGAWDPTAPESNAAMKDEDLELPFLASGTLVQNEVWGWGKKIENAGTGEGKFQQVLLESPTGGGTVGQLATDLANCSSALLAGGNMVGLWSAPNPAIGWLGNCTYIQPWFENVSKSTSALDTGALQVGLYIEQAVAPKEGPVNVQDYCNRLSEAGAAPYTNTSGAADIGYGGWGLGGTQTVASCLSRLNGPATSANDAGAVHVKWWNGGGSQALQEVLGGDVGYFTTVEEVATSGFIVFPMSLIPSPFNLPALWLSVDIIFIGAGAVASASIPLPPGGLTLEEVFSAFWGAPTTLADPISVRLNPGGNLYLYNQATWPAGTGVSARIYIA